MVTTSNRFEVVCMIRSLAWLALDAEERGVFFGEKSIRPKITHSLGKLAYHALVWEVCYWQWVRALVEQSLRAKCYEKCGRTSLSCVSSESWFTCGESESKNFLAIISDNLHFPLSTKAKRDGQKVEAERHSVSVFLGQWHFPHREKQNRRQQQNFYVASLSWVGLIPPSARHIRNVWILLATSPVKMQTTNSFTSDPCN